MASRGPERPTPEAAAEVKAVAKEMWGLGDYDEFARAFVWQFGPELVEACAIGPGQRVLDVATGTGNVALRAAEAGASVVALDLSHANLAAGRASAEELGLELEWVEGDAEALPFEDASFDVVTSSVGAMFAPDHQAVADELLRVCRPGGTIGMINYTPDGGVGDFFGVFVPYLPPSPPGVLPPVMWGDEAHVRELFGDRADLELERRVAIERLNGSPRTYVETYKEQFGPVVATFGLHVDDPQRTASLDREFLAFAKQFNHGPDEGPVEYRYGYLLVVARKRA